MAYEQIPNVQNKSVKKAVGPKIVAVTSPRPLIVQVQSLTQSGGMSHDPNDIPCGNTINKYFFIIHLKFRIIRFSEF